MFGPAIMVSPVTEYMYHRPPEQTIPITPDVFRTKDGKPGLTARYYCDVDFKNLCHEAIEPGVNINWYTGWPAFVADPKFSIRWEGKLIPAIGGKYRFNLKSFGPRRLYLDGQEVAHSYDSMESHTVPVDLVAGKEYDFKFETSNDVLGAFRSQVYWKTPEILAREAEPTPAREKTRNIYLPAGTRWIDFWTGDALAGGVSVAADAPIDKIPLMVRAGSIVPMGPFIQYAAEKPDAPIELRIYPGADGSFTLYEDENDNYNYEKGVYSTIEFSWDDARHQLTIDSRKGSFPGMVKTRTFDVVVVRKGHGTGVEAAGPDKTISYRGERQTIPITF
jgi:alpha-D-xyloside xylohydrolase